MNPADPVQPSDEPECLWLAPEPPRDGALPFSLEISSRGDVVPGQLLLPAAGQGPWPLLIAQLAPDDEATRLAWARAGAAVARVDLPLEGARSSPKLAACVEQGPDLSADVFRQGVADLQRLARALRSRPEIDAGRVAYMGFGAAAGLGAVVCAEDSAIACTVLGPADSLDPDSVERGIAPRSLHRVDSPQAAWAAVRTPLKLG